MGEAGATRPLRKNNGRGLWLRAGGARLADQLMAATCWLALNSLSMDDDGAASRCHLSRVSTIFVMTHVLMILSCLVYFLISFSKFITSATRLNLSGSSGGRTWSQVSAVDEATEAEICNGSAGGEGQGHGERKGRTPGLASFTT